ncbi:hypothetical protein H8356DRAFT_931724 [Neocallimastix lanati (nom. inval.)]
MSGKSNTLLNNNMNEIINKNKNNSEASLIKPLFKELSESKASEVTLKNSSEIELSEDSNCTHDISKNNETITTSKNSKTYLSIIKKRSDSKEAILDEENKTNDKSKVSSKKGKYTPELKNKYLKNGRSIYTSSEIGRSTSTNELKASKSTNALLNNSIATSTTKQRETTSTSTTTAIKAKRNSLHNSLDSRSTINNNNSNNISFSQSSSTNNISTSQAKKAISIRSSSQENSISKKFPSKQINSIRTSLLSNKPLMNQSSRKTLKSDLGKNTSYQNDLSNRLDRSRSLDYIHNRNDSQLKSKKLTSFQKESNSINEKEIVLKSNEYRRAIAKINSLEKTIKQLQTQHSETLASLHSEIARLQRACSEKTLVEAFQGTGLLTSLSDRNNDKDEESNNNTNKKVMTSINRKNDMNNNVNISNKISEIGLNNEIIKSNEENKSYKDSVGINKMKNSSIDINERINDQKKKMASNIKVHKYNSIEKLNLNSIKNSDITLKINYDENPPLSDNDLSMDRASSFNSMQTYVSLSDASTAVALSSGHSSSLSSLIKSEMSLNRQLPPPLPPNYPKSSIKLSDNPKHLINLPKIIQPITKVKENKNTSINLPSLIKNKASKNSHKY